MDNIFVINNCLAIILCRIFGRSVITAKGYPFGLTPGVKGVLPGEMGPGGAVGEGKGGGLYRVGGSVDKKRGGVGKKIGGTVAHLKLIFTFAE
ncbi:MAG: hypothetical protein LBS05_04765 [Tannerellaceae bacterium]|jgi:hypothetical protein|nr:hypothetical protein [Tannerellaceae bacterium]